MKRERIDIALEMAYIHPGIGSILLIGPTGCGKSHRIRAFFQEQGIPLVTIPIYATQETLCDHLDIKETLQKGTLHTEEGLLSKGRGGVIYIDDVDHLSCEQWRCIRQQQYSKEKGLPIFTLVGTINTSENEIDRAFINEFDLIVVMCNPTKEERITVLRDLARASKQLERQEMVKTCVTDIQLPQKEAAYREKMASRCLNIRLDDSMRQLIAEYCTANGIVGNVKEICIGRAASAIAVLDNKEYVLPSHIETAIRYTIFTAGNRDSPSGNTNMDNVDHKDEGKKDGQEKHERPQNNIVPPRENKTVTDRESNVKGQWPTIQLKDQGTEDTIVSGKDNESKQDGSCNQIKMTMQKQSDGTARGNDQLKKDKEKVIPTPENYNALAFAVKKRMDSFCRSGAGRQMTTHSKNGRGRYIRAVKSKGDSRDIALEATVRAAALRQGGRREGPMAIVIHKEDIYVKLRETRVGRHILFVVDTSGSMGAKERMEAVKGTIAALLQDAYEKRDVVGVISFRRMKGEVILPFTRSVVLARQRMEQLSTGGRTPLAEGIRMASNTLQQLMRKQPMARPLVVFVTDGRATYGSTDNPVEEAYQAGRQLAMLQVDGIILNTEQGPITVGIAKPLAEIMGAAYYHLDCLKDIHIIGAIAAAR